MRGVQRSRWAMRRKKLVHEVTASWLGGGGGDVCSEVPRPRRMVSVDSAGQRQGSNVGDDDRSTVQAPSVVSEEMEPASTAETGSCVVKAAMGLVGTVLGGGEVSTGSG